MPDESRPDDASKTTAEASKRGDSPALSVVVNTRNEAGRLPGLVESVTGADEVLVADMQSDDDTQSVARSLGARVIELPNAGFCEPGRMPAIRAASHEWVLVLDADERLPAGAMTHLRRLLASTPPMVAAYRLPRVNHIGTRAIRGSGWGLPAELHPRLFRRDTVDWPPIIHVTPLFQGEVLDLPADGPIRIDHDNFDDLSHMREKLNRYSSVEANALVEQGLVPSLPMALRFGLEEVIARYDPETDGSLSLVLSLLLLSYRFDIHAKAAEALAWPDDLVIARDSMVAAVNAMWSTLRLRELHRLRSHLDAASVDEASLRSLQMANHLWAESSPSLSTAVVDVDDAEIHGPWVELEANEIGRGTRLAEAVVSARVLVHRTRQELERALARTASAEADRDESKRLVEELIPVAERSAEREQELELALAAAQARIAELEHRPTGPGRSRRALYERAIAGLKTLRR
jgi:glycosyltransferase involved in cell wall biosynthesis